MKRIFTSLLIAFFLCNFAYSQDAPLVILEKPTPNIPLTEGCVHIQGTVRLKVEFLESGSIGKISLVSSLPYGLTESAIEAARKIKFSPEIKNGNPANKAKTVEYYFSAGSGWSNNILQDEKAEAIIKKAVEKLGGEKYLQAKSVVGTGNFTTLTEGQIDRLSSFVDVIVFPDKERTEFKMGGVKNVQTNVGASGWLFDGAEQMVKDQNKRQIEDFRRGVRTSLDNLLRGNWRKEEGAALTYAGRRQAGIGRRNDVVKLTYPDGFAIEFEFSDDGMPAKSIYKRTNTNGEEIKEEDRYAQFVNVQGITAPFIVDHFVNDKHTSRINFLTIEFNKPVPDTIFSKPSSAKELKKDLKL